jgi:hypothetical protein
LLDVILYETSTREFGVLIFQIIFNESNLYLLILLLEDMRMPNLGHDMDTIELIHLLQILLLFLFHVVV